MITLDTVYRKYVYTEVIDKTQSDTTKQHNKAKLAATTIPRIISKMTGCTAAG